MPLLKKILAISKKGGGIKKVMGPSEEAVTLEGVHPVEDSRSQGDLLSTKKEER